MPDLGAAISALALAAAAQGDLADPAAAPLTAFVAIDKDVRALWASDPCLAEMPSTQRLTCWSAAPERLAEKRARSQALVARLAAIQETYPSRSAVLRLRLNLLTRAALFCDERDFDSNERDLLATDSRMYKEWIGSLDMCARTTGDFAVYDMLRGSLSSRIARNGKSHRAELLRIWFESFVFQHNPKGDLALVAKALNAADVESWKTFTAALKRDVASWRRYPDASVSTAEVVAAKKAVYAL